MTPKYKTTFVKMTNDPQRHARALEKALNELAGAGWTITRFDHDTKKGTLIISHKIEAASQPDLSDPRAMLAAIFGARPTNAPEEPRLHPAAGQLLDQVFDKLREKGRPLNEEELVVAVPPAVDAVCRKYPNPQLRAIKDEVKRYYEAHLKMHKDQNSECEESSLLKQIVTAMERHITLSTA